MTASRGHCPRCHRPAVLHDDHPTCDDLDAWDLDTDRDDDGTVTRGGCLALLAAAWVLLAAAAWTTGAPASSSVIDAALAVAVAAIALAAWRDRDQAVTDEQTRRRDCYRAMDRCHR